MFLCPVGIMDTNEPTGSSYCLYRRQVEEQPRPWKFLCIQDSNFHLLHKMRKANSVAPVLLGRRG
uniref:Uncharacterized protein n=1 Tax=Populus trichocarpa TaxID=3694 RepID=A9PG64_POPTR|nr:unknown [Populus trichocarpa]